MKTQNILNCLLLAFLTLLIFDFTTAFAVNENEELSDSLRGTICIAPLPKDAKITDRDIPGKQTRKYTYNFNVQIDSMNAISVTENSNHFIENLDIVNKHLVIIRDGENIIESFWFSFEDKESTNLCLFYVPWYQTWLLDPLLYNRPWCKCQSFE